MLTDLGLQNQEQIDSWNNWLKTRFQPGNNFGGCIDKALCKNCNHMIMDSLCLCGGQFDCPNCSFKNRTEFKTSTFQLNTDGVLNSSFSDWPKFYTKNDFLKIVDKVFDKQEKNEYEYAYETWEFRNILKQEIEKL